MKGGLALAGAMLVLAFVACPGPDNEPEKNSAVTVGNFQATVSTIPNAAVTGTKGDYISKAEWGSLDTKNDIDAEQRGTLNFTGSAFANTNDFVFKTTGLARGAVVTYAYIASGTDIPGSFVNINTATKLANNGTVYFRIVSENGANTVYYCFTVSGLAATGADPASTTITNVVIGGSPSVNATPLSSIDATPTAACNVPINNATANNISLSITKGNASQTVNWYYSAGTAPADEEITGAFTGDTTNVSAVIKASGGVAHADRVYIKVVSMDKSATSYYGYIIGVGNTAELDSLTLGTGDDSALGPTRGATWTAAALYDHDIQDEQPVAGFALSATAKEQGTVSFIYSTTAIASAPAANDARWQTPPPATVTLRDQGANYLYFKVVSYNTLTTAYYRVRVLLKSKGVVYYGRPKINGSTLDPLWADDVWNNEWPFDISRNNTAESIPAANFYRFNNTVNGTYEDNGFGHTAGKARAYWDDTGLYIYAQMDYLDYYADAADKTISKSTTRTTTLSGPGTASSSAHTLDSLEIYTNERYQAHKAGDFGNQFRIAPTAVGSGDATGTDSHISGEANNLTDFTNSGNYFSWVRKSGGKEVGYSVLAHVPWGFQDDPDASNVFDETTKLVKAQALTGPTIGMELQINACTPTTTSTARDAILTWNGVTGQSYQQVRYYGVATLAMGSGRERDPDALIDAKAIPLAAPRGGGTPATVINASQYTGTVTWSPTATTFAYETSYTATVTLKAKGGYTLAGLTENFGFTVAGSTSITNTAAGVVTVVFPATLAPWTPTGDYTVDLSTLTVKNETAFPGQYGSFTINLPAFPATFEIGKYTAFTITAKFFDNDGEMSGDTNYGHGQIAFMRDSTTIGVQYNLGGQTANRAFSAMDTPLDASGGNPNALQVQNSSADVKFIEITSIVFHVD